MPSIASLAQTLADTLVSALPLATQFEPHEPEATIAHRLYAQDGDSDLAHYFAPGAIDTEERGGLWGIADDTLTAHQKMQLLPVRQAVLDQFHALTAEMGRRAPILSGPWLRMSASVWPRKPVRAAPGTPGVLTMQCTLFASVPGLLAGGDIASFGADMEALVAVLSPLGAPTGLYRFASDSVPIPGANALEAAMLWDVVEQHNTALPSLADAKFYASIAGRLTPPEDLDAAAAAFARRAR